jgi:hypothetical protein
MTTQRQQRTEGGIPDGLILGVIGFLLGMTVLLWTATGIAGLLSHGAWPAGVHFTRTPIAMRHLIGHPHDLAAAWPDASPEALPKSGLFWGIFIGQLMVLFVLTVFVIGVVTRRRLVRARRAKPAPPAHPAPPAFEERGPGAEPLVSGRGGVGETSLPVSPPTGRPCRRGREPENPASKGPSRKVSVPPKAGPRGGPCPGG